jgi:tetratricopeptide (TPR) repeat protein
VKPGHFPRFFIASIALLLIPLALCAADDPETAAAYLIQAEALFHAGDLPAASRLVTASLEFYPVFSEGLYLQGRISLARQETTLQGIDSLRKALAARTWTATDPDTASQSLARALVRTGKLEEAVAILQRLVVSQPEDPENLLLLSMAYEKTGKQEQARTAVDKAIRQFTKNESLYMYSSRLAERAGRLETARHEAVSGLDAIPESLPLLLRSIEMDSDAARRLQGVDSYVRKGGKDPLAAAIALESQPKDQDPYLTLFFSLDGLSRLDLTARVSTAVGGSAALSRRLVAEFSRFSGARAALSDDGSGFFVEKWEIRSGVPTAWVKDVNTDGVPEFSAVFRNGAAQSLSVTEAGVTRVFTFDPYPFIDTVTVKDPFNRSYFLSTHSLGCFMLQGSPGFGTAASTSASTFFVPSQAQVVAASFREQDSSVGGSTPGRRVDISGGLPVYVEEDLDGDGKIDHRVWYVDGKPTRGERDLASSGIFNETETFRNGILWKRSVDSDGDGKIDYAEQIEGSVVKMWDYNEDGLFDCRESRGAGGMLIRELSMKLDGVFDLKIVFKASVIISVVKGGRSVAVTPDPQKGIVWIGAPARAARIDAKAAEGVQILSGKPYLLFRYAGTVYFQELE